MTKHYSEADLLETYYMRPDEATAVIAHVNECRECQDRYRRLAKKLREIAVCPAEKPATFWTRQRLMIMRTIENARQQSERTARTMRIAAAAVLAFLLGGAVVYKSVEPVLKAPAVVVSQQTAAPAGSSDDLQLPRDPWQSEELKDFGSVVQWESWVPDSKKGASSL
jgi:predicted anti-sigma-YlaC factor YlaD